MIQRSLYIILLLLLVVSSCKVGKNYEPVKTATPPQYLYQGSTQDSIREIAWWELFNDEVMDTLIAQALEHNQNLLIAAQNVEQAALILNIQRKELLPRIDAAISTQRGNFIGGQPNIGDPINIYGGFGNLSWEIDLFGKLRRLNEAALADYLGSEYGLRSLRLELIANVASTYLQMREYEESYRISMVNLRLRDSSLNLIQARFDEGYSAMIELNQAQIQKAIAASAVPRYKRLWLQSQNALSVLTGSSPVPPDSTMVFEKIEFLAEIPEGLPSELLRHRPDLLESEQNIIAQNALVGAVIGNRFPSLNLTGMLGVVSTDLNDLSFDNPAWSLTVNLLAPIFNWGQNKRRVDIERSRLEQSYLNYRLQVLNAFREVEDALIANATFREEFRARQDHVKAALNAQYLSGERYQKGVTSYLEYLESQRQAFDAQIARVSAKRQFLESYVRLYKALGGGWMLPEEE